MLVTTLNARLLDDYGRATVATWSAFTKRSIVVVVLPEEVSLFETSLGSGYTVLPFGVDSLGCIDRISATEKALDYRTTDYRYQASRFSWKVFALHEAFCQRPPSSSVAWLDADSLLQDGFDSWWTELCPETHSVSYFGRSHKGIHAETGLMNFAGPRGQQMFERVLRVYTSLELFEYREWHDAYIFTSVFQFNKRCFDISRHHGVRSSNPIYEVDRGRHIVHLKGARKAAASPLIDRLRVFLGR
jgi:hypothetical protein